MREMFTRLRIAGLRRLADIDVPLRELAIVIGPNGSGKTTFLDAWNLLGAAAEGQLQHAISARGGYSEVATRDGDGTLDVTVDARLPVCENLRYRLVLGSKPPGHFVGEERLTDLDHNADYFHRSGNSIEVISAKGKKSSLGDVAAAVVGAVKIEPAAKLSARLRSRQLLVPIPTVPRSPIRVPQQLQPADGPEADGSLLASCLHQWKDSDPDRFEMVEDTLRAAFPGFERLGLPAVAAGMVALTWKERTFSRPLYMNQLSEGTLRFLWFVTLLASPKLPAVLLIDEPEVSLHPQLLRLLLDLMRAASRRTQIIVATHSDRLVRFATPEEVLVADMEEGKTNLRWADTMDLDKWLGEYSLDQVWDMGVMGGRP